MFHHSDDRRAKLALARSRYFPFHEPLAISSNTITITGIGWIGVEFRQDPPNVYPSGNVCTNNQITGAVAWSAPVSDPLGLNFVK
jgi:hypothetical protein